MKAVFGEEANKYPNLYYTFIEAPKGYIQPLGLSNFQYVYVMVGVVKVSIKL
jgi:hypothetical protein